MRGEGECVREIHQRDCNSPLPSIHTREHSDTHTHTQRRSRSQIPDHQPLGAHLHCTPSGDEYFVIKGLAAVALSAALITAGDYLAREMLTNANAHPSRSDPQERVYRPSLESDYKTGVAQVFFFFPPEFFSSVYVELATACEESNSSPGFQAAP